MTALGDENILKNPLVKNILSALAVAVFGFILLNLTFFLDFIFQNLLQGLIGLFTKVDFEKGFSWLPQVMHGSFVILIGIISFFVLRSKLDTIYKATFLTVPLSVVFVTLGILLFRWPIAAVSSGFIVFTSIIYYLYRTKQHWLYYYSVSLIGLVMLAARLMGAEL